MNNDYIQPAERVCGRGRWTRGSRICDARLVIALRYRCARIRCWMRSRGDLFVVYLSVAVIAILVWLAIDDLIAWMFGLAPVTL